VEPPLLLLLLFHPEKWRQQVPTKLNGVTCHKAEFLIGEVCFLQHVCGSVSMYNSHIAVYLLILVLSLFNDGASGRFMEVDLRVQCQCVV
jgi:hypothetical protein